ncbi:hypothetical protein ILYODFUR_038557, partial [Ilyodon furcidens]
MTTLSTPTAEAIITRQLVFRSHKDTFISDLEDPSSSQFKHRVGLLLNNLVPLFRQAFVSFLRIRIISFRNGSIINTLELDFASHAPTNTAIEEVLFNAASSIADFSIETSSIVVSDP